MTSQMPPIDPNTTTGQHTTTAKPGSTLSRATTGPGALSANDIARKANDADHKSANLFPVGGLGQGKSYFMKKRLLAAMNASSITTNDAGK